MKHEASRDIETAEEMNSSFTTSKVHVRQSSQVYEQNIKIREARSSRSIYYTLTDEVFRYNLT